ncbi:recombinase family protein [Mesorhizobium sp. B2-4-14]|uniref:recombinase family protein n=1 Tax=Mesorhizobium sp. B2-4-14 TaxID=2589935 RepID=UPI00112CA185|nr:recombinase family protein [Mesorhizobium sp. B2-4-14]TPK95024.1 recombinase family protein [Mesorhizobium sp. B2-4-14]
MFQPREPRDLKGRTAISYARWSSGKQAHGDSLDRQTKNAEDFCRAYGLTLDRQLVDDGISAFKGANLDASFGKLVADIKNGVIPSDMVLLVENVDRISRINYLDANEYFLAVLKTGLTIVTMHDQRVHTIEGYRANFMHMVQSILSMQSANEYSEKLSKRVKEALSRKAERARAGRVKLAKVPFWIDHETQELNARASDARLLFDLAKQGLGQLAIAQTLNERGILSPSGGTWSQGVVGETLRNPAAFGTFVFRGDEVPGYFPALITETEWLASRSRTKERQHSRQVGNTTNLFSRMVYCAHCGSSMAVTSVKRGGRSFGYLTCTGKMSKRTECQAPNWRYSEFEAAMLSRVGFLAVPIPEEAGAGSAGKATELDDAIDALEAKQGNILAGMAEATDAASRKFLLDQSAALTSEIEVKRGELIRLREEIARNADASTALADFELDQQEIERLATEDRKEAQRLLGNLVQRIELESDSKTLRRAMVTMRGRPTQAIVFDSSGEPG